MNYFIFTAMIIGWLLIGLGDLANCKEDRVNGEMIIFFTFIPFIPFLAKIFL